MTELRAIEAGTAIEGLARAAYEYLASCGSLLLFALLCLGWCGPLLLAPNHPGSSGSHPSRASRDSISSCR